VYVYATNGNCSNESSFDITIVTSPVVDILPDTVAINSYLLPTLNAGSYYTDSGGTGIQLYPGDEITSTQTLYIYETNGLCWNESSFTITIQYKMNYIQYFTPNGDGINEYWQIDGGNLEPNTPIYIYNRYGKLLAVIRYKKIGWDGTINNHPVPSDDYWFKVKMRNGVIKIGHFSLKRNLKSR